MDPITIGLIVSAISGGLGAAGNSISNRKNRQSQETLTREQIAAGKEADLREAALRESGMDPFRHQLSQAQALSLLDELELGSERKLKPAAAYAKYVPEMTGGYERSPEIRQAAGALKRNVLAGQGAPTQTSPANYGRTSALDLVSIFDQGIDPADPTKPLGVGAPGGRWGYRGARPGVVSGQPPARARRLPPQPYFEEQYAPSWLRD
jgi:hypothetical protein